MTEISEIQIHEAKRRLDQKGCLFVDIRDPDSFRSAHIPGAIHLHDANLQEFIRTTGKESPVVVYCYHGNNSLGATAYLLRSGFRNVVSISGGFEAWRQVYEHESE